MEGSNLIVPAGVPIAVDTAEQQKKNNGVVVHVSLLVVVIRGTEVIQ